MNKQWNRAKYTSEQKLIKALQPFVDTYEKMTAELQLGGTPNEHMIALMVTLGDCRRAASALRDLDK